MLKLIIFQTRCLGTIVQQNDKNTNRLIRVLLLFQDQEKTNTENLDNTEGGKDNSKKRMENTYWSIQMAQVWVCITMIRRSNWMKEGSGVYSATGKPPRSMKCCFHGHHSVKTRWDRKVRRWHEHVKEQNKNERRERQSNHKCSQPNYNYNF